MFGTAAMLDGLAQRVQAQLGAPLTVVATGGLAPLHHALLPPSKSSTTPTFCSKDLALLWERNREQLT